MQCRFLWSKHATKCAATIIFNEELVAPHLKRLAVTAGRPHSLAVGPMLFNSVNAHTAHKYCFRLCAFERYFCLLCHSCIAYCKFLGLSLLAKVWGLWPTSDTAPPPVISNRLKYVTIGVIWEDSEAGKSAEMSRFIPFSFLPCDAMRCTVSVIVILSACPSVCPSVTLVDCVHTVLIKNQKYQHVTNYDHDFFTIW